MKKMNVLALIAAICANQQISDEEKLERISAIAQLNAEAMEDILRGYIDPSLRTPRRMRDASDLLEQASNAVP